MENIKIYKDLNELEQAFIQGGYSIGSSYIQKENLGVCLYGSAVIVMKLHNAMKRGKEVKSHIICFNKVKYNGHPVNRELLEKYLIFLGLKITDVAELIKRAAANALPDMPGQFDLEVANKETKNKAIRVFSPFAELPKVDLNTKWNVGKVARAIVTKQIIKGSIDRIFTDDYAYDAATNFQQKNEIDLMSFAKELTESPSDWRVSIAEETDDMIKLSLACFNFDYRTLYVKK
ncbi:hypothetical protein ACTOS9_21805 (plasmid) [Bacillus subtilis]|uniref:Uncharacterized protein n=1 Tax=Bacillus subtilis TaxID=1423 RepID=A0A8I1WG40_BACIU|nr:hypothetical protein [Bacillus subtilis]MBO3796466.1 hypothetical protein [Bacillus subtilis]WEY82939.1 hypothetical protein P5633_00035 [Bacillus subtilis]